MPHRSSRLPAPILLFLGDASAAAAGMKVRASAFIKQVVSAVIALAKAKSASLRSKTSAMKARILVFALLRNKKALMTAVAHKVHALTHGKDGATRALSDVGAAESSSGAVVIYRGAASVPASPGAGPDAADAEAVSVGYGYEEDDYISDEEEEEDEYPDLRHTLFDLEGEDEEEDELPGGSVIEMVKTTKEEGGEQFNLEDEIDHVADMFIQRFHKHIRIEQKKRYKEMLQRGSN